MPLDTILCLDTSGSMAGRGLRELKGAVETFLDGVQQTAQQTGLRENVAIVEFGKYTRVVQGLTTNYALLKQKVEALEAGGQTPMFEGLVMAIKEILKNGGVLVLSGTNMKITPRVILMTDGRPDDQDREKVLATAAAFGPDGYRKVGLPIPVPMACVGLGGDVDKELLVLVALLTRGMFSMGDASHLSTFFRRQMLLVRFLVQFKHDMAALRDLLVLRAFLERTGECVDREEAEALMKLLLAMMILESVDPPVARRRPPRDAASDDCCVIL